MKISGNSLLPLSLCIVLGLSTAAVRAQEKPAAAAATAPTTEPEEVDFHSPGNEDPTPAFAKKIPIPDTVRTEWDVPYISDSRKEKADIYIPTDLPIGQITPAILVIHGGGFNDGDKARNREVSMCLTFVQRGYLCMSINYKLSMKGKATWPQCLYDAKTAVRWLRKNAERLHIDPNRIGVMGSSAGGNLAAMLALTQPKDGFDPKEPYGDISTCVSCAVDFYGAVDLMNYHDMKMFNATRAEAPESYRAASPIHYAHSDAAPLLIVHGTNDKTVHHSQSETLARALATAGAPHQLVLIPDAPHTFDLQPKQRDLRPLVLEFFDKHLKGVTPAK